MSKDGHIECKKANWEGEGTGRAGVMAGDGVGEVAQVLVVRGGGCWVSGFLLPALGTWDRCSCL